VWHGSEQSSRSERRGTRACDGRRRFHQVSVERVTVSIFYTVFCSSLWHFSSCLPLSSMQIRIITGMFILTTACHRNYMLIAVATPLPRASLNWQARDSLSKRRLFSRRRMLFDSRGTRNREGHGRQKYISSTSATVCRNSQVAIFIYGASRPMRSRRATCRTLCCRTHARVGRSLSSRAPSLSRFRSENSPEIFPPSDGFRSEFLYQNFEPPPFTHSRQRTCRTSSFIKAVRMPRCIL